MASILMILGSIISLVGAIMVLIVAFKKSIWWGLGSLLVPFVILVFIVMNWQETSKGFFIMLGGWVLMIIGTIMAPEGMDPGTLGALAIETYRAA